MIIRDMVQPSPDFRAIARRFEHGNPGRRKRFDPGGTDGEWRASRL